MQAEQFRLLQEYLEVCQHNHHRGLVLIAGDQAWTHTTQEKILGTAGLENPTIIETTIEAKKLLGAETRHVFFNAFNGFNLNGLAICAGSIGGGGLLILRCPGLSDWSAFNDPEYQRLLAHPYTFRDTHGRFLKRFSRLLLNNPNVLLISQNASSGGFCLPEKTGHESRRVDTRDQSKLVDEISGIIESSTGVVLVTADRGRGKSALLGLIANKLANSGLKDILITAPSPKSTTTVFKHLDNSDHLSFKSPDELVLHKPNAGLVMIDEAAAIPLPVLESILRHYPKVVMTTTIHGYEGTGRAIVLRFGRTLDQIYPRWLKRELHSPIRFAAKDPLEQTIHDSLILNAETSEAPNMDAACQTRKVNRDELADNEGGLRAVFGLLMLAHYKTRPDDLRHLLDAPNIDVFVVEQQEQIIATAMVANEGQLESALVKEIAAGKRRPRGHLLPQTLIFQSQLPEAGGMKCARIIRIAVLPPMQRRGLGATLLKFMEAHYKKLNVELIGTSFGLEPGLQRFWENNAYSCVRIGHKRNAASGFQSGLFIKSLAEKSNAFADKARHQFVSNRKDYSL